MQNGWCVINLARRIAALSNVPSRKRRKRPSWYHPCSANCQDKMVLKLTGCQHHPSEFGARLAGVSFGVSFSRQAPLLATLASGTDARNPLSIPQLDVLTG
jgi:hypothetical protein